MVVRKTRYSGEEYALDSNGFFALKKCQNVWSLSVRVTSRPDARTLHGLGAETHWAFRRERPLRSFDDMLSEKVVERYQEMGMQIHPNATPLKLKKRRRMRYVITFENGESITTDAVIFGTGRQPNTDQWA